jgi:hypothetical protein
MPKRTLEQTLHWSQTNYIIGQRLRAYYRACISEEIPPRLRALTKRLENSPEFSTEEMELIRKAENEIEF